MEKGLGLLLSAGWTLDQCLDLSWEQLGQCIRCVVLVKAEQAEMIIEAVAAMMGAKPKKKKNKRKRQTKASNKNKDDQLMEQLAAAGIRVEAVGTAAE